MARPLRYEEAGAVYHLMPRGDGGKNVFEEDKDCFAWTDLLEKAHETRLSMGHEVSVTRAVRRFRDHPKAARRLKALERKLGIR